MTAPNPTPNPFRKRSAKFNVLKLRALEAFENRGWINPIVWAAFVGFYPARAAYSYLLRLRRFRLLERGRDAEGLIVYHISNRGRERLNFLRNSLGTPADKKQRKEVSANAK
jgi:hypothetical protein